LKKILAVKLCCIGDIIQVTPSLRSIKQSGAEVHYLCVNWVKDLVTMVPFIDRAFIINRQSPLELMKVMPALIAQKYDLIINFHRDLKSSLFISLLGAKETAGFNWKRQGWMLKHRFDFDSSAHEGDRYLSVVKGLGFPDAGIHTEIKAPEMNLNLNLNSGIKAGLFPGGGKNPGTVMITKRWPVERFLELIDLMQNKGITPYILGGEIDSDVAGEIKAQRPDVRFIKTADINELAVVLSKMDVFIAGDTGPLHMSAALSVPTIGLFGPTSPELVGVRGKNCLNIWKKHECAPCYEPESVHQRKFLECTDNICMKKISAQEVLDAALKLTGVRA